MGTNLSMIVHICGMNVDNYREYGTIRFNKFNFYNTK